jgi:hypothetical protein
MARNVTVIPEERIEYAILSLRGQKVMLDRDLAQLYGVPTKALNQAVRRNSERFPEDFMFQLSEQETKAWWDHVMAGRSRSQFVTLNRGENVKYRPYAFTEHGILMLSSVLKSQRAIMVNIAIMRTFVRLREMLASNAELSRKLEALEKKYDRQFRTVFEAIHQILEPSEKPKKQIGFLIEEQFVPYVVKRKKR